MDYDKQKRSRVIKLIITEIIMVATIAGLVAVLMLVVSGYRVNDDLSLEQSGLVQMKSIPTGATIEIDGEQISAKTDSSKLLKGGEHTIKLTKKGYDSWEKQIRVTPGWLLRIRYARLFKLERESEEVQRVAGLKFYSPSPTRTAILYAATDEAKWHLLNIRSDAVNDDLIDVAAVFGLEEGAGFEGAVEQIWWSKNGDKVLMRVNLAGAVQWVLLDLRNMASSVNLTQEFGLNFTDVQMANEAADRLLVLENANLRELNLTSKEVSKVLLKDVAEFLVNGSEIGYVTLSDTAGERTVGIYKNGDAGGVVMRKIEADTAGVEQVHVAVTEHFNEKYLVVTVGDKLYVYKGDSFPAYGGNTKALRLVIDGKQTLAPAGALRVSYNGEFVWVRGAENQIMMVDAETDNVSVYTTPSAATRFVDDYLLNDVVDSKLVVWDFDGGNRRELASGVANYSAVISANNHYLYYVAQLADGGLMLTRERL